VNDADRLDPICVDFRLSLSEYRGAIRSMMWALWPYRIIVGLDIIAFIGGLGLTLTGAGASGITLLGVAVVWSLMLGWMFVVRPGRQYQRQEQLARDQSFCFGNDEVSWTFIDGASKARWSYFDDVMETPAVYVLRHQRKRLGQLVPKRAFRTSDDETRFRAMAQHRLKVKFFSRTSQPAGRGSTPSSSKP